MSENAFWHTLGKQMKLHEGWRQATRHEDKLNLGICDVSFVNNARAHGWIELKKLHEWPKRESTIVRLRHFTDAQRIFLKEKGEAGGNCWLLLKVYRDVLLFDWWDAYYHVGYVNKERLLDLAAGYWPGKMDYSDLGFKLCVGEK